MSDDDDATTRAIDRARTLRAILAYAIEDLEAARQEGDPEGIAEHTQRIDAAWGLLVGVKPDDERAILAALFTAIDLEARVRGPLARVVGFASDEDPRRSPHLVIDSEPGALAIGRIEPLRPEIAAELAAPGTRSLLVAAIDAWRLGARGRGKQAKWRAFEELALALRLKRSRASFQEIAASTLGREGQDKNSGEPPKSN